MKRIFFLALPLLAAIVFAPAGGQASTQPPFADRLLNAMDRARALVNAPGDVEFRDVSQMSNGAICGLMQTSGGFTAGRGYVGFAVDPEQNIAVLRTSGLHEQDPLYLGDVRYRAVCERLPDETLEQAQGRIIGSMLDRRPRGD